MKFYHTTDFQFKRYKNREFYISKCPSIAGERIVLFGSFTPPDENLLRTLLTAHTLKKEGAKRITLVVPFAAYMRHDKIKSGLSLTTAWLGGLIKSSGVDRIVTVDLHSERDRKLIPIPIISISPAGLFAKEIRKHGWQNATIVAPDNGAIARCADVAQALKNENVITHLDKKRTEKGVLTGKLIGKVTERCILVDDQLDTGTTLVQSVEHLKKAGAEEFLICVTHGLFVGEKWKKLKNLGVREIITTDTISHKKLPSWISEISVSPIVNKFCKSIV